MKILLRNILKNLYHIVILILRLFQKSVSNNFACKLQNIFLFLHLSDLRFFYDDQRKLFIAKELDHLRYFGEMNRGFDLYGRSLFRRGKNLFLTYCLNNIQFNKSDIVIDCGANYADLFIELSKFIPEENYLTFEPGPIENKCINLNVPNAKNYNYGLSNVNGKMKFYISSKGADSSLVEPKNYSSTIEVNVVTLDTFLENSDLDKCKLLKLEAEGFELEILEGGNKFIKKCEYIALDGGPERGVNEEMTFSKVNNFLLKNDYILVDFYTTNSSLYRALFKNNKFKNLKN